MRLTMEQMVARAQAAEAAGFDGIANMDHLAPPLAESQPMTDAMITNTWLAGRTEHLRVGSLVLCDSFRHPAVLAREAVTIDQASGGRFELGIGWGSVADEFRTFGIGSREPKARLSRLRESLEIMQALWAGEKFDYEGEHFTLHDAQQQPGPIGHIPIVIGGAGKGTMQLVAAHADWWNVHTHIVDKLDEMRPLSGNARCSLQVHGRRSRRWRDGASERPRSSAPRPSSSTISERSRREVSSGSMRGSATSPRSTRWRLSARPSSGSSARPPADPTLAGVGV
jgi:alkanesulfonate monooxygenase SsuD/methylene tetrahydromethanopterin reductase-like flavin-dependent oxidoreductase (luciferase family)